MSILVECPACKRRNSLKNDLCAGCGFGIKKAKSKVYWVNYRDAQKRNRYERIGASKLAAENRLQEVKKSLTEGRYIDKNKNLSVSLDSVVKWYLQLTEVQAKKSYRRDQELLGNILRVLGSETTIQELSLDAVERFKVARMQEPSPRRLGEKTALATINKELSALKTMLNKAEQAGRIDSNPIRVAKMLQVNNVRERVLNEDEFERLLDCCPDHVKPIVIMAYHQPMRRAEIVGLVWDQVDIERGFIRLSGKKTKTGEGRVLKLHPRVLELLRALPKVKGEPKVLLKDGLPFEEFRHAYSTAVKVAGLGNFTFHDLRHCAINNMRLAGNDYFKIMA